MLVARLVVVLAAVALLAAAGILSSTAAAQDTAAVTVEITSFDVTALPTATLTANVYRNGIPLTGLTADNFALRGALADSGATITRVENITADNIPISVVLVIDTSSSMFGAPLERAKAAAVLFVNSLRDTDQIALIEFNSDVRTVSGYTSDKALLTSAINGLASTGRTALYDATLAGVELAAAAPTQRRVVVFLSDGQEDRGSEVATRFGGITAADESGIPVYTIGFGSVDQEYMARLADAAGAQFFLAPSIDQLEGIYADLASALRSQYIITLNVPVESDGTDYPFDLVVTLDGEAYSAGGSVRAPIPVPVVRLPDLPAEPLTEPTAITATVLADDPLAAVAFQVGAAAELQLFNQPPYAITIDPALIAPGPLDITVIATDEDGDEGRAAAALTIAALPPTIVVEPDPSTLGDIAEPVQIAVTVGGQTSPTTASYQLGADTLPVTFEPDANPYTFTLVLDPREYLPGEAQTLTITVENEGGESTSADYTFTAAALPPVISVIGLVEGQQIDAPVNVLVEAGGQVPVETIGVQLSNGVRTLDIAQESDEVPLFVIDPLSIAPGSWTVTVTAEQENGQASEVRIPVIVSALPPVIQVDGLEDGETLDDDRQITVTFQSQTPVVHLAIFIDGVDLAHLMGEPFQFTIRALDYAPGEHILRLIADNTSGQSATRDLTFSISGDPGATATQIAAVTATQQAVVSATVLANTAQAAAQADATQTAAAVSGTRTQNAAVTGTAAANAVQTRAAQQVINATATGNANATATADADANATATGNADATATADADANATATGNAGATQTVLIPTQTAEQNAVNTAQAQTATLNAATQNAARTATRNAQATQAAAAATQTLAQAATDTAVQNAISTATAQTATQDTINAQATQTAQIATASAVAVVNATQTSAAATAQRQATSTAAQGTILARQAADIAASETAAVRDEMIQARTATANAILAGTDVVRTETAQARSATETAQTAVAQQAAATEAAATQTAENQTSATSTAQAVAQVIETETPVSDETAVTVTASPTAPTATRPAPTVTDTPETTDDAVLLTAEAQTAPTITPTLVPVEIEQDEPLVNAQNLPLILVGVGILLILLVVIYLILTSRQQNRRRR
ncbi:MAG: VWA domain-containing protein [bacterium]|nr:VWA domain-containing protein [bacterium]